MSTRDLVWSIAAGSRAALAVLALGLVIGGTAIALGVVDVFRPRRRAALAPRRPGRDLPCVTCRIAEHGRLYGKGVQGHGER